MVCGSLLSFVRFGLVFLGCWINFLNGFPSIEIHSLTDYPQGKWIPDVNFK